LCFELGPCRFQFIQSTHVRFSFFCDSRFNEPIACGVARLGELDRLQDAVQRAVQPVRALGQGLAYTTKLPLASSHKNKGLFISLWVKVVTNVAFLSEMETGTVLVMLQGRTSVLYGTAMQLAELFRGLTTGSLTLGI
jgi:hypothetical protein